MNRNVLELLVREHARMLEDPIWSQDNPAKDTYYGLLNQALGKEVTGVSGQHYTIRGVGFHPNYRGVFDPGYCEGYIVIDAGIVHLGGLEVGT